VLHGVRQFVERSNVVEFIQYDKITVKNVMALLCKDLGIFVQHSENCEFLGD